MVQLTEKSQALFDAYANDAGNWSGTPLVGVNGNVTFTAADRGNLTDLKKAGLISTFESDREMWISFTDAGRQMAKERLGVIIE